MTVTVTVTDPARARDMERVFGSATVPVKGSLPQPFRLPGLGVRQCFLLDIDQIDGPTRQRLYDYGAGRFGLSAEVAERELNERGFPILADSCIVSNDRPDFL